MGIADTLLRWLADGSLAATGALLLVLILRKLLRRVFGARVAYGAWALVPLALVASLLPRPDSALAFGPDILALHPGVLVMAQLEPLTVRPAATLDGPLLLTLAWLAGMALAAYVFVRQQRRFVAGLGRLARDADGHWRGVGVASPAVVGALRPRIVLPADFESRHAPDEVALMVAHERVHLARGDARANLAAVALRCLLWFHPLVHLAARSFRLDQELACDAAVVANHPHARRRYASAMLNAQLAVPGLPVGCHWQSSQSLKERILMLKQSEPGARVRRAGAVAVCVLVSVTSYGAWAFRPADTVATAATGSSQTPVAPVDQEAGVQKESWALAPPRYPADAIASQTSGKVVMRVLVGADGSVKDVVVEESVPAGVFDAVAVEAAHKWQFTPAVKDGEPVEGWVRVPVHFDLDPPEEPEESESSEV